MGFFLSQRVTLTASSLLSNCGSNSYEICKLVLQMKMISGRYRSDRFVRHFIPGSDGNCTLCSENVPGNIDHILVECVSLSDVREQLFLVLDDNLSDITKSLTLKVINSGNKKDLVQFLLDCSANPDVISATQHYFGLLDSGVTYKLKLQGSWTNQ